MATTAELLAKLQNAMPVANQQIADQQRAARAIQLQSAVAGAPPVQQPSGLATQAQTLGAGIQDIAGQQAAVQQKNNIANTAALTQAALAAEKQQQQGQVATGQLAVGQQQIQDKAYVAAQQRMVEDRILANELQFKTDELGRNEYQDNQLLDYALISAKDKQDLSNKLQTIDFATKQNDIIMNSIYQSAINLQKAGWKLGEQQLDQKSKERIQEAIRYMNKVQQDRANRGAMSGAMKAAGGVVGGVIGAVVGGYAGSGGTSYNPYAGAAGAVVGAGVGTAAGGEAAQYT